MILTIIGYKNKKINAFTNPVYIDVDVKNYATQIGRALKTTEDLILLKNYQNLEMYCLGEFDDETGVISNNDKLEFIVDISKVAIARLKELEHGNKKD